MRTHEIQIEHDQFDTPESYQAYALHGEWFMEQQTAADLVSNWRYERESMRSFIETAEGYALATVDPIGAPVVAMWERNDEGLFRLSDFPFKTQIVATTPPPPEVRPLPEPSDAAFAEFGKRAAAILAGSEEWDSDTTSSLAEEARSLLGVDISTDMDEETWLMFKPLVEQAGMEMWAFEDEED